MSLAEYIKEKRKQLHDKEFLEFGSDEISGLKDSDIKKLITSMDGCCLMKLPAEEIDFFEWLKQNDSVVWKDLWESENEVYLVSLSYLRPLRNQLSGFPICDLENIDNYWFCADHLKPKARELLPGIAEKIEQKKKLKLHEMFLAVVNAHPIDIWHFAYHYKINIKIMRDLIAELEFEGLIVHLKKTEDLLRYIE